MLNEILGWGANIFFIYGVYALGKKNIKGFYLNCIANLLYVVQSYLMDNSALLWLSLGLIILNIKGIINWSKENESATSNQK